MHLNPDNYAYTLPMVGSGLPRDPLPVGGAAATGGRQMVGGLLPPPSQQHHTYASALRSIHAMGNHPGGGIYARTAMTTTNNSSTSQLASIINASAHENRGKVEESNAVEAKQEADVAHDIIAALTNNNAFHPPTPSLPQPPATGAGDRGGAGSETEQMPTQLENIAQDREETQHTKATEASTKATAVVITKKR